MTNDLVKYLRDADALLQSEYERIRKRASEDPGTAGDNAEENWASLLRLWLPKSYQVVTKGRIMNVAGECGPQVDILILSPAYPEALLAKKEYLDGGVIAAFECKLTLKARDITKTVENAATIRRIASTHRRGTPHDELCPQILYGLLAHSHSWQREAPQILNHIAERLRDDSWTYAKHPCELLDFVCVSNLATWDTLKSVHTKLGNERTPHIPQHLWESWVNAGGVIQADFHCHTDTHLDQSEQSNVFSPVGFLLKSLQERLAWSDHALRPLTIYFDTIGMPQQGHTSGHAARMWPLDVLTPNLAKRLKQGTYPTSTYRWHPWHTIFP